MVGWDLIVALCHVLPTAFRQPSYRRGLKTFEAHIFLLIMTHILPIFRSTERKQYHETK